MNVNLMHSSPIRSLHHVGVSYPRRSGLFRQSPFWALNDVSFDLFRGEVLGIIGRNGAGKTTLLQLLADIIKPDRGTLQTNGAQATMLSLQIGFIPNLSGRENVIMSGLLLGLRRSAIQSRMKDIIAFSELEEFIDQPVRHYSTGMRARLGFSVALQLNPDIFLIDEVMGVGDANFKKKSSEAMLEKFDSDRTFVLVSHDLAMIRRLCSRVVWIEHGATRAEGNPAEIVRAYQACLIPPSNPLPHRPKEKTGKS